MIQMSLCSHRVIPAVSCNLGHSGNGFGTQLSTFRGSGEPPAACLNIKVSGFSFPNLPCMQRMTFKLAATQQLEMLRLLELTAFKIKEWLGPVTG